MTDKTQHYIKLIVIVLVSALLLFFSSVYKYSDKTIEDVYSAIAGERIPDSNIIIIHIAESDLEKIGPWPIKRSYYALLIKNLTKQGVNKIGLEVFLSSRLVIQSIYDKLLKNEIEKSGRVVLSSLSGRIIEYNGKFYSDSLSYPSPKLLNENFLTGHLNYIPDNGITVPLVIDNRGELEKAFSYQLFGKEIAEPSVLLNFRSSWKKFKSYSLIEYFELVQKQSSALNYLKNKTVLIGMSNPQIASTVQTAFDDELPGVALHAFALDNLMNSRWINRDFYLISGILFVLILLGLVLVQPKVKARPVLFYVFSFGMFLLITFILTFKFNYKLALSFFIFPFLFVFLADALLYVFEKRKLLHGALDESEVLKRLLEGKQNELLKLQNELDITEESGSHGLIEKIRTLKTEIDRFKEDEKDKIKADIYLSEEVKEFHGIVYGSKAMDKVVDVIKKGAPENATILIVGESGTGKELVANAIHSLSARKDKKFIAVNCAALTESLLESELFGHVKGAFTGANNDKIGKFEAADKGTIFLDEIGETSENFQVKLLRVLQSGEIEKVGSAKQSHADVRVVAATNKNLDLAVKEKKFREDLYYRLNVIQINLPPLRERKEDVKILALHFLSEEDPELSLSKAAANAIVEYDWKGNVRELESVIKRAVIFSKSEGRKMLQLSDFPKEIVKNIKYDFEDLVLESLRNKKFSHSSISDTAKELGNVNRTMIAENFRGIVFRTLCENNFDVDASIATITGNESDDVKDKVSSKVHMFINNIENDIKKAGSIEYSEVKLKFVSKYKNLPVKFHSYLDEVIKWKLKGSAG